MIQLTERNGRAYPLAFDWESDDGAVSRVKIEKVFEFTPCAEQKSGVVGDRYDCQIGGQHEYLYYSLVSPRKWFKLKPVSEDEYKAYYRLPGEGVKEPKLRRQHGMRIAEDPAAYGAEYGANLTDDPEPGAEIELRDDVSGYAPPDVILRDHALDFGSSETFRYASADAAPSDGSRGYVRADGKTRAGMRRDAG